MSFRLQYRHDSSERREKDGIVGAVSDAVQISKKVLGDPREGPQVSLGCLEESLSHSEWISASIFTVFSHWFGSGPGEACP